MPTPMIDARAKIHAAIAALTDIKKNLTDAVGRAELRKVIQTLERGEMQLDAALLENEEDRCTYCGAPPDKQMSPNDAYTGTPYCPKCWADIPQPPPETAVTATEPDVGF